MNKPVSMIIVYHVSYAQRIYIKNIRFPEYMKAILILAGPYSSCHATEIIWQEACKDKNIELEIFESTHKEGKKLSTRLNIKSFPALIINNKVVAVGHPNEKDAPKIIEAINS